MLCILCLAVTEAAPRAQRRFQPNDAIEGARGDSLDGAESEEEADWNSDDERELQGIDSAANTRDEDRDSRDDYAASNQIRSLEGLNSADELDEPSGSDSNIENAKINMNPQDMATAAGHHHHHKHYVHGWLKMGAHTGKKGSFGWHDKHPVGGKGKK